MDTVLPAGTWTASQPAGRVGSLDCDGRVAAQDNRVAAMAALSFEKTEGDDETRMTVSSFRPAACAWSIMRCPEWVPRPSLRAASAFPGNIPREAVRSRGGRHSPNGGLLW